MQKSLIISSGGDYSGESQIPPGVQCGVLAKSPYAFHRGTDAGLNVDRLVFRRLIPAKVFPHSSIIRCNLRSLPVMGRDNYLDVVFIQQPSWIV
ncbi:hypothetical protein ASG77_03710 [Arthrobacter sp. Soil762]|nr:hypothetical protein ASG77_03710 [Arthrobacter sp. Soil762]